MSKVRMDKDLSATWKWLILCLGNIERGNPSGDLQSLDL